MVLAQKWDWVDLGHPRLCSGSRAIAVNTRQGTATAVYLRSLRVHACLGLGHSTSCPSDTQSLSHFHVPWTVAPGCLSHRVLCVSDVHAPAGSWARLLGGYCEAHASVHCGTRLPRFTPAHHRRGRFFELLCACLASPDTDVPTCTAPAPEPPPCPSFCSRFPLQIQPRSRRELGRPRRSQDKTMKLGLWGWGATAGGGICAPKREIGSVCVCGGA